MNAPEAAIQQLERELLSPNVRRSPERLAALLADDYVEFAASGVAFDKRQIMEAFEHDTLDEPPMEHSMVHHEVLMLGESAALSRYRIVSKGHPGQEPSQSLHSSVWVRKGTEWRLAFHQGTLVSRFAVKAAT